jgi:hypothetical protein
MGRYFPMASSLLWSGPETEQHKYRPSSGGPEHAAGRRQRRTLGCGETEAERLLADLADTDELAELFAVYEGYKRQPPSADDDRSEVDLAEL